MTEQKGQTMKQISYTVRSKNGNEVAKFDTLERAEIFKDNKASQGVMVRIYRVETVEVELEGELV